MLKLFLPEKTIIKYYSPNKRTINKKFKASKSLTNFKSIKKNQKEKRSKSPKYSKYITNNFSNIINLEKNLTQKEKAFKRNVSNKILMKKDLRNKICKDVASLEDKIIDNYNSLKNSNYIYNQANKNILNALHNKKRFKILNKEYTKAIYKLKNDIGELENKIEKYKNWTELYERNYKDLNEKVIELKKECKILPGIIDNLEKENNNLKNLYIKMNSNIIKIKYKLFDLDKNEKNISWNLYQINKLYK